VDKGGALGSARREGVVDSRVLRLRDSCSTREAARGGSGVSVFGCERAGTDASVGWRRESKGAAAAGREKADC
jgi:hypothetical protein